MPPANESAAPLRLTQYSHGSGCGCKLAPSELESVLAIAFPRGEAVEPFPGLVIGNETKDDAAVYDVGGEELLVSTTDFFTPVVDDPYTFGRIAAANALSDVYAMGGRPILALAVLGWPVDLLDPALAAPILKGGQDVCREAGIPLAGGHSIDAPEPFFGLAVNGLVRREALKTNAGARVGDHLFLTKPLGTGLLSTAEKHGTLRPEDAGVAAGIMGRLNAVGEAFGTLADVHAMTDVTGFGLLGHLLELCDGAGVAAELEFGALRLPTDLAHYVAAGALAKGLKNNWRSYGHRVSPLAEPVRSILCDPQTGGGLLIAVGADSLERVREILSEHGLADHLEPVGRIVERREGEPVIQVRGHQDVPEVTVRFGLDAASLNRANAERAAHGEAVSVVRGDCAPLRPAKDTPGEMWKMMKGFFTDWWHHRRQVAEQATWIERYAAKKGYRVNPHWMMNTNLRLWLVESQNTFGQRICPCFEPSDDPALNRRITCPCAFVEEDIQAKNTCHCTLFGRGDLTDEEFSAAETRLMQEYRVDLRRRGAMIDTSDIPTDPLRGLKVPDAYHQAKRGVMLYGVPLQLYVERDFEVRNLQQWARTKGLVATSEPEGEGFRVTLDRPR